MKRLLVFVLVSAMIFGMIPSITANEITKESSAKVLTEEDYILADLMWEEVNAKEEAMMGKKAPTSKTVEALIATVMESPYYAEDSLVRNGDHFFWETVDGIACGYSPRLSERARTAERSEEYQTAPATVSYSYGTREGKTGAKDVYVIQPYYGIDKEFTTQYVTEAQNIAKDLGGTATVYRTSDATIDTIADALEQGAVVFFDSHGDTDYMKGDDCVSRANTSYICLQYNTGITDEDMRAVVGKYGTYHHAYYAGSYGQMKYYCVDGTAIANHMEKKAPHSFLWMALCLSMATDGLHKPLMEKGISVTYGYSQSVTFEYDYKWEAVFWTNMIGGKTVAQAIGAMKTQVGLWDWCHGANYDTISEARDEYCAFPIVVSAQDTYPGKGNVDDLQTVRSTWVLCPHSYTETVTGSPCTAGIAPTYTCSLCGFSYTGDVIPATGHSYVPQIIEPTCEAEGYTEYTCSSCGDSYRRDVVPAIGHNYYCVMTDPTCTLEGLTTFICETCNHSYNVITAEPLGHRYEDGSCTLCGRPELPENPFADVEEDAYYGIPVLWALKENITNGITATTFGPEKDCTRGQVVTFLWRACGSPEPASEENPFKDISVGDYYYKAVLWAVEQGITQGTGRGKFSPEQPCTRGQVATFLWRAQEKPEPTDSTNIFSDVEEDSYYYTAVLWAVEQSITQGTGKGKFSPENTCTRGQIVTFLYRALA